MGDGCATPLEVLIIQLNSVFSKEMLSLTLFICCSGTWLHNFVVAVDTLRKKKMNLGVNFRIHHSENHK